MTTKLELTIQEYTDIEQLRNLALYLVTIMRKGLTNYNVAIPQDNTYFTIADGSYEYCRGYSDSRCDNSIVVCHDMVVYPDDRWGEQVIIRD